MYTPAGYSADAVPWIAIMVGWVLFWIAIIIAVRPLPRRDPPRQDFW
jgi:hypothetical protein